MPDGTESIGNLQTLSRTYTNNAGQDVREDDYFKLSGVTYSTAANLGTKNTNYYELRKEYDANGWLTRQVSATGTITRTVNDGQDRVVSVWVGTDDTPALGQWSPNNNTSPANMAEVSRAI